jgi:hypothetical protein
MTDIRYSSDELDAFKMADRLSDGVHVEPKDVLKVLLAVTHSSYQARKHLDKAMWGLVEKSKAKREDIRKIIASERA